MGFSFSFYCRLLAVSLLDPVQVPVLQGCQAHADRGVGGDALELKVAGAVGAGRLRAGRFGGCALKCKNNMVEAFGI